MSAKGTKGTKKPKVLPIGLSVDGLSFSQTVSRSGSTVRSPVFSDDDENGNRGRSSSARRSKVCSFAVFTSRSASLEG